MSIWTFARPLYLTLNRSIGGSAHFRQRGFPAAIDHPSNRTQTGRCQRKPLEAASHHRCRGAGNALCQQHQNYHVVSQPCTISRGIAIHHSVWVAIPLNPSLINLPDEFIAIAIGTPSQKKVNILYGRLNRGRPRNHS